VRAAEDYELRNKRAPVVPRRSKLYCLDPIGVGSGQVEGLASYLMRLAEAHHIETGILMDEVGAKLASPCRHRIQAIRIERLCEHWCEKDGVGQTLRDWVRATEKLTLRKDLSLLTMLSWGKIVDLSSIYRRLRSWCPSCIERWDAGGRPIYEPLLWNIQEATICPVHLRPLRQVCSDCHQSQSVILKSSRVGCCARCGGWLGAFEGESDLPESMSLERQRWRTLNIEKLVLAIAESPLQITRRQLIRQLAALERSNHRYFYKRPIDEVRSYINGERPPSLSFLLGLCWELKVNLIDFLTFGTAERRK
jgi:hypothetical protein